MPRPTSHPTSLALSSLALCASALTGCAALVPETKIKPIAPAQAQTALPDAVAFADQVAAQFDDTQFQISYTEAGLGWGTLALATVVGYDVMFSRSISTLRAPVLGLAFLQGVETSGGVRAKRDILDAGSTALACAKRVAYTMDALPAGVGNEPVDAGNPSPMAQFARSPRPQEAPLAPTPRSASARAHAIVQSLREAPKPVAPVAGGAAPTDVVAGAIASSVASMDAANAKSVRAADQAKLQAPQYLASTVELVARQVLTQLHAATPSLDAIVSTVRTQSKTYLSDAKDALDGSANSTGNMAGALEASKPVMAQAVRLTGQLKISEDAAAAANEEPPTGFVGGGPHKPRADVHRSPTPAAAAAAAAAASNVEKAAADVTQGTEGAAAQAQATQSTALTVKQLLDFAANCDK